MNGGWKAGSEQGETSPPARLEHSEHRAAARLCPQPVSKQRSLSGRQPAESCNLSCYPADADWQSSYWIVCPRPGVFSGAAGAWRHSSTSYVKNVNKCQAELADSCWSLLLQPTTGAKNSDSERKSIKVHRKHNKYPEPFCMLKASFRILKTSHIAFHKLKNSSEN